MFQDSTLQNALETSHTIDSNQAVWVEWNLNQSYNINKVGNYRYRPGTSDPDYGTIRSTYDAVDPVNTSTGFKGYYTGGTDSDVIINAGVEDDSVTPVYLTTKKKKINLMYSLDDCFKQNRPRSGINKLLYLGITGANYGTGQYVDSLVTHQSMEDPLVSVNVARRPRYYMASRYDDFKYWTSYRSEVENNKTNEFGISINSGIGSSYYIYDTAPFVVYNNAVPTNRIAVKMQTNVGEINNGPYRIGNNTSVADPLYGDSNRTVPRKWRIQALDASNKWYDLKAFSESETRSDGSLIIKSDGQVEIEYGLEIPALYQDVFTFAGVITSISMRPNQAPYGYAYLYKTSETDKGILYISDGASWQPFTPSYKWVLSEDNVTKNTRVVTKLTDPDYYLDGSTKVFREFQFIYGLRIVVETMNKVNCTFDLIELSPRLVADITDKTISFSVKKTLSDLGTYSLPTGSLLASTGSITIFDEDLAFNENNIFDNVTNKGSIISQYSNTRIKFLFYDIVKNIGNYDYYLPIKTLYSERIPQISESAAQISIDLRDLFFLLESKKSPELLLTNVSLSYAITVLLDNIGFSNYTFKRTKEDEELIIPYFFVGPDQNVAETLQQLAISSQSAIFFDEYNDLIIMSKNYLLPSETSRATDITLYGQETGTTVSSTRTNLMPNPSFEVDVSGWFTGTNASITRSVSISYDGGASAQLSGQSSSDTYMEYIIPCEFNTTYAVSMYVWLPTDASADKIYQSRPFMWIVKYIGGTNVIPLQVSPEFSVTGKWQRIHGTFTTDSDDTEFRIRLYGPQGGNWYVDNILVEKSSTVNEYFDGSYENCSWTGTPHLSTSTQNIYSSYKLPNIINVSSQEKRTYNGGEINYTTRYIQRSIGSISQAPYIDDYKTFVYKPVLLWEVAGQESTKTINEAAQQAQGYSLASMPLKTTLPAVPPSYNGTEILDNYIDFGESVYWLGNYAGYFYANGEVIRYDAVEYSIAGVGNVWITNNQEYQNYFGRLRFNGKMYPTGRVRIYTKIQDGEVKEHGRGQFDTEITEHRAGTSSDSPWINDSYVRGCIQNAKDYLFNTNINLAYPTNTGVKEAGKEKIIGTNTYSSQTYAVKSVRDSIIKNFMANPSITEKESNYNRTSWSGSVQSSALVFNGPNLPTDIDPVDFVTYAYNPLDKPYKHFGTRMRIIGKIESGTNKDQTPVGAFDIYSADLSSTDPSKQISITGGSGGLCFGLNKDTNVGYYYEIAALSQTSVSSYNNNSNSANYSISKSPVVEAKNDVVTVTLTAQHDFEIGTDVIVSGLIDDNYKTSSVSSLNGQFKVTAISADRKQFKYSITPPTSTTAAIVSVTGDGTTVTYTCTSHPFSAGQKITITGTTNYNLSNVIIQSVTATTFTVTATNTGATSTGTATYVPLTTIVSTGGSVTRVLDSDTLISDVFLYKVVSGSNTADIINISSALEPKKSASITAVSGNGTTVTYTAENDFAVGDVINISGIVPTSYNLTNATVTAATPTSFSVTSTLTTAVTQPLGLAVTVATWMVATLKTLREHSLLKGEPITVSGIATTGFSGNFTIISTTAKTIKYVAPSASATASTDLSTLGLVTGDNQLAIPEILWRGFTEILVDDGKFTTQQRLTSSEQTTVYDLSVEYLDIGTTRQFYLYLNDKQIAVVNDTDPIPLYNNIGLFVRGSSRVMFENVYALSDNFSENNAKSLQLPISKIFGDEYITESDSIRKYAISGIVQNTYLTGIGSEGSPAYNIYYEEFGTIMREAAYFKIRYDRAYPALYAQIAKTINRVRGYTVSGFYAGSYGAEFLIFNAIDKNLNLDDTSGNYLRILGIAFTQNTTHSLKVDDFFKKNSNFTNALYSGTNNSESYSQLYNDVQNSRNKYGRNDFSIDAQYVQTDAAAESMMDWTIKRVIYPKRTVGINTFATPHIQLGDIIELNYKDSNSVDIVAPETTRFVVYNIEYQKSNGSITTTVYLAEV